MTLSQHVISSITTAEVGARYLRPVGRNSFRGDHGTGAVETAYVVTTSQAQPGGGSRSGRVIRPR